MTNRKIITEQYKSFLYEQEKSKNTIEKYIRDVNTFYNYLQNRSLDKQAVIEYKNYLTQNFLPASVNSMLSSLNCYFLYIKRPELKVKTLKIQRQLFKSARKELTKAEYERLVCVSKSMSDKRLYYLLQTFASTGIRVSELSFITVEAVKRRCASINNKGKIRQVFIPTALCSLLLEYVKKSNIKSGPVFVSKTGKPLDRSNIWRMLKRLCSVAKVAASKVFPHNLRHLFAKTFYTKQKDIVRLADILGHTSINTTRIYTAESGYVHIKQLDSLGLLIC